MNLLLSKVLHMRNPLAVVFVLSALMNASLFAEETNIDNSDFLEKILREHYMTESGVDQIRSFRMLAEIADENGKTATLIVVKKQPDLIRTTVFYANGTKVQRGYDGKNLWSVIRNGEKIYESKQMSSDDDFWFVVNAPIPSPLIRFRDKDWRAEYLGEERDRDMLVYNVRLHVDKKSYIDVSLNSENYLATRYEFVREVDGTIERRESYFSDYKQVGPIQLAFTMVDKDQSGNRTILKVKNVSLNDGIFPTVFDYPSVD